MREILDYIRRKNMSKGIESRHFLDARYVSCSLNVTRSLKGNLRLLIVDGHSELDFILVKQEEECLLNFLTGKKTGDETYEAY